MVHPGAPVHGHHHTLYRPVGPGDPGTLWRFHLCAGAEDISCHSLGANVDAIQFLMEGAHVLPADEPYSSSLDIESVRRVVNDAAEWQMIFPWD
jgi:hypothetical protein